MSQERSGVITFKGDGLTLVGPEIKVGDAAPAFTLVGEGLKPVSLADSKGKVRLISVVPSLDTPVCDKQTRTFNEKVGALSNVATLTVSLDLPFAQGRFCSTAGIENITTASDYKDKSFGQAYGVLIKELQLLTRAIFVVDASDKVTYVEVVKEVTHEPDYDKALAAVQAAG